MGMQEVTMQRPRLGSIMRVFDVGANLMLSVLHTHGKSVMVVVVGVARLSSKLQARKVRDFDRTL